MIAGYAQDVFEMDLETSNQMWLVSIDVVVQLPRYTCMQNM